MNEQERLARRVNDGLDFAGLCVGVFVLVFVAAPVLFWIAVFSYTGLSGDANALAKLFIVLFDLGVLRVVYGFLRAALGFDPRFQ